MPLCSITALKDPELRSTSHQRTFQVVERSNDDITKGEGCNQGIRPRRDAIAVRRRKIGTVWILQLVWLPMPSKVASSVYFQLLATHAKMDSKKRCHGQQSLWRSYLFLSCERIGMLQWLFQEHNLSFRQARILDTALDAEQLINSVDAIQHVSFCIRQIIESIPVSQLSWYLRDTSPINDNPFHLLNLFHQQNPVSS
ncbi:hypothetical protein WG66_008316 [Moniliophthora roreri]|nr:hypothetical protein WG66_008316 [Moniliophthora roreri]